MIKRVIGYILAIFAVFIISAYTYNYELMYGVLVMIFFPILDVILINNSAKNIKVNIDIKNIMLKKGEAIPIETMVINKGILPVVMVNFKFLCKNMLHNTSRDISLQLPVLRWGNQHCIFSVKSEYCGDICIELKEVKVLDYFGLVMKSINKKFIKKIYILPNKNDIDEIKMDASNSVDIEGKEFSSIKPGDDSTEVFDIRGYRPGDKLHSIHWKLSSRRKEIMVKEYSLPINSNYSIIMDLTIYNKNMHKEVDSVIEFTMDLILKLQEQGINHQIIAYERNGKYVFKDIIENNASMVDIMYELYQSRVFENKNLLQDYDFNNEVNDETNVYYISSRLEKEDVYLLDNTFKNAKKIFLHIGKNDINQEYKNELENMSNTQIIGINIDSLENGLSNIYI